MQSVICPMTADSILQIAEDSDNIGIFGYLLFMVFHPRAALVCTRFSGKSKWVMRVRVGFV